MLTFRASIFSRENRKQIHQVGDEWIFDTFFIVYRNTN